MSNDRYDIPEIDFSKVNLPLVFRAMCNGVKCQDFMVNNEEEYHSLIEKTGGFLWENDEGEKCYFIVNPKDKS